MLSGWAGILFPATPGAKRGSAGRRCRVLDCADGESARLRSPVDDSGHGKRRRLYAAVVGPAVVVFAIDAGALFVSCPHGSSGQKAIRKFSIVGTRSDKKSRQRRRKCGGGGKRAVSGRAIPTLPPRRSGAPTAVLLPERRSAAVWMGRGGIARTPEAEWSSGVAAFLGGVL